MKMQGWDATLTYFRNFLLTSGKSPGTARTYCSNLNGFKTYCARYEIMPDEADRNLIRSFLTERLGTVSAQRSHNDLAALKLFYAYLIDVRYREDDPTIGLRVKRPKSLPTKPLLDNELQALLSACTSERDRLLLLVMASTGVRVSELCGMTAEDIDWERGIIKIRGKGSKERIVAPTADVLGRLHAYVGMFPSGPIWLSQTHQTQMATQTIRNLLLRIAERAHVDGVHPHRLRSTFATAYIDQHGDIQALQGVMGHESIETTSRYTEYTKEKRGLQQMRSLRFVEELAAGA